MVKMRTSPAPAVTDIAHIWSTELLKICRGMQETDRARKAAWETQGNSEKKKYVPARL